MPNIKEVITAIAFIAIGYAIMLLSFHAIIAVRDNIVQSYLNNKCELIENKAQTQSWYECDKGAK